MVELTTHDYITRPASELMKNENYSPHAHRVALALMELNTTQLENLDLPGVMRNG